MQLSLSTWVQVQAYLKKNRGCILPIGSTEQHGPTGPIGTDAICAEVIAKELGDAVGALVIPTINVGMSVHHLAFPGSMTLRPSLLQELIVEYVFNLAAMGLDRFFIVNGHGGNEASINAATWEIFAKAPQMQQLKNADKIDITFVSWWNLESANKLRDELFGKKEGGHATPAEISIAMYAHPECNWRAKTIPNVRPSQPGRKLGRGTINFQKGAPDGRCASDPTLADPRHGRRLVKACVKDMSAMYRKFVNAK